MVFIVPVLDRVANVMPVLTWYIYPLMLPVLSVTIRRRFTVHVLSSVPLVGERGAGMPSDEE